MMVTATPRSKDGANLLRLPVQQHLLLPPVVLLSLEALVVDIRVDLTPRVGIVARLPSSPFSGVACQEQVLGLH